MFDSRLRSQVRSRIPTAFVLAAIAALVVSSVALSAPSKNDELLKDEQHRLTDLKTSDNGTKAGSAWNIEVVGQDSLGDRGEGQEICCRSQLTVLGRRRAKRSLRQIATELGQLA